MTSLGYASILVLKFIDFLYRNGGFSQPIIQQEPTVQRHQLK